MKSTHAVTELFSTKELEKGKRGKKERDWLHFIFILFFYFQFQQILNFKFLRYKYNIAKTKAVAVYLVVIDKSPPVLSSCSCAAHAK